MICCGQKMIRGKVTGEGKFSQCKICSKIVFDKEENEKKIFDLRVGSISQKVWDEK